MMLLTLKLRNCQVMWIVSGLHIFKVCEMRLFVIVSKNTNHTEARLSHNSANPVNVFLYQFLTLIGSSVRYITVNTQKISPVESINRP